MLVTNGSILVPETADKFLVGTQGSHPYRPAIFFLSLLLTKHFSILKLGNQAVNQVLLSSETPID